MLRGSTLRPSLFSTTEELRQLVLKLGQINRPPVQQAIFSTMQDPADAIAKRKQQLKDDTALDAELFDSTPHSKLMQALIGRSAQPAECSMTLLTDSKKPLESNSMTDFSAVLECITHRAIALLAVAEDVERLKQVRPTMHLVGREDRQLGQELEGLWNSDMAAAFKASLQLLNCSYPQACNQLLLLISELAARDMCLTATSLTSSAQVTLAELLHKVLTQVLDTLSKSLINSAETQLHGLEVRQLQNTRRDVFQNKQTRFKQLTFARALLALPSCEDWSFFANNASALASINSQQYGVIVISDSDGLPTVTSGSTTVNFGDVLSSGGRTDRTIRVVNHTSAAIHIKVQAPCTRQKFALLGFSP